MATVGSLVVKIGADISGFEKGLNTAQGKLRAFGSQMKSIGSGLTLGLTAPIAGIATAALKSAAGFEQSMNLMQAMSGATAGQMEMLQEQALALGASTVFSAGEAAEAMLELSKAGMSVEQTSAAIGGVMDLAAAGNIGLAEAATITANAINSFGLEASSATDVANTFAAAANASSADVKDLAAGFQMAGAVFASNGQSVNDLAAALAVLSNNGIAGSDAGTSLKTMMMRLAAPTAKAAKEMDALGLSIFDSTGAMLPFGDIVAQLETATAGLSDAQRNAALSTIFGADAIRAATILASEGGDAFREMEDAVGAEGAAALLADAQMRGLGGAIEYFKGAVDSVLIGAALPFTDQLGSMIRKAADLLSGFTTLSPEVQRFAAVLVATLAVAGPLLVILGTMATALAALMSPIGLVIAGLVLLAAVVVANWGTISTWATQARDVAKPALDEIATTIDRLRSGDLTFAELGAGLLAEMEKVPQRIQAWAGTVDWAGLMDSAGNVGASIKLKVTEWFEQVDFSAGATTASAGLTKLRDSLLEQIGRVDWAGGLEKAQGGLNTLRDTVTEKIAGIDWGGALETVRGWWDQFTALRDNVTASVSTAIAGVDWGAAGTMFSGWVDGLTTAIDTFDPEGKVDFKGFVAAKMFGPFATALTVVEWVIGPENLAKLTGAVTTAIGNINWAGIADSMFSLATAVAAKIWDFGIALGNSVAETIREIDWGGLSLDFAGMMTWVGEKIGSIDWAAAGLDLGNMVINLGTAVGEAIGEINWGAALGATAGALGKAAGGVVDFAGGLAQAAADKLNSLNWSEVTLDFTSTVQAWATKITETDWSAMGAGIGEKIRGFFDNLFNGGDGDTSNPFVNLVDAVRNAITSIQWVEVLNATGDLLTSLGDAVFSLVSSAIASLFGATLESDGSWRAPAWVQELMDWMPEVPEWVTNLIAWVALLPEWVTNLLDWVPDLPQWVQDLMDWTPDLPDWVERLMNWQPAMPGWVGRLLGWLGVGGGNNATGTPNWTGGATMVGEFGPELVVLPAGARIYSNQATEAMVGGGGQVTFNVTVNQDLDWEELRWKLNELTRRRG